MRLACKGSPPVFHSHTNVTCKNRIRAPTRVDDGAIHNHAESAAFTWGAIVGSIFYGKSALRCLGLGTIKIEVLQLAPFTIQLISLPALPRATGLHKHKDVRRYTRSEQRRCSNAGTEVCIMPSLCRNVAHPTLDLGGGSGTLKVRNGQS